MMNLHDHEKMKSYPARYPLNQDSIGIELIGKFDKNKGEFESVTPAQNASLQWLIKALLEVMNLKTIDVFR
ncbi:MAG: N-acetylmuramoyl-L-alanine amidase, partial [bacterium]